jgi:hypothetical protein
MPEIEIELEPIAEGQAELAREIGQLEAEGKRILDIRYPDWAADIWELFPTHKRAMPGPMAPTARLNTHSPIPDEWRSSSIKTNHRALRQRWPLRVDPLRFSQDRRERPESAQPRRPDASR